MGNRAIYSLKEDSTVTCFFAHYGANALSPLLRLSQAMEIQRSLPEKQTIAYIFEHLDYDGIYQAKRLTDADMFFERIRPEKVKIYQNSYKNGSELEMWITLDLDKKECLLDYNPNCRCYRTMGSFSIGLDAGLENVHRLMEYGEKHGITDFYQLLSVYHRSTGLINNLESSYGSMRLDEYLRSPQSKEKRCGYQTVNDWDKKLDFEEEEMEER